jgi:hypothetical protein
MCLNILTDKTRSNIAFQRCLNLFLSAGRLRKGQLSVVQVFQMEGILPWHN